MEQQLTDAQQVAMGMTTPVSQGDWRLMFVQHDRIQQVTPEDVVRVAKAYIKDSNLTVGVFIPDPAPDRATVPNAPTLSSFLRPGYKSSIAVSRAEEFDPTPGQYREARGALQAGQRHEGGHAAQEDGGRHGIGRHRTALRRCPKTLSGRNAAAQLAGSLLMSGTKTLNRQQIQDEMEKLNARIQVSGGGGGGGFGGRGGGGRGAPVGGGGISSASATITVKPENLPAAMRLAMEMLREPAYPEAEFDRVKGSACARWRTSPRSPNSFPPSSCSGT
jgi:zinc protease